jgi:LAO/AO transport system kinase
MPSDYLKRFYAGETLALARIMSRVERGGAEAERLLRELFSRVGNAYRVAVTGMTGSGKSTLLSALIARERTGGRTVGVIAEDPSSPFSGGAVLGDRVRMNGFQYRRNGTCGCARRIRSRYDLSRDDRGGTARVPHS